MDHKIIILSEKNDNPGTSITNAIEQLVNEIYFSKIKISHNNPVNPDKIRFVENYNYPDDVSYDNVKVKWIGNKYTFKGWQHIGKSKEDVFKYFDNEKKHQIERE